MLLRILTWDVTGSQSPSSVDAPRSPFPSATWTTPSVPRWRPPSSPSRGRHFQICPSPAVGRCQSHRGTVSWRKAYLMLAITHLDVWKDCKKAERAKNYRTSEVVNSLTLMMSWHTPSQGLKKRKQNQHRYIPWGVWLSSVCEEGHVTCDGISVQLCSWLHLDTLWACQHAGSCALTSRSKVTQLEIHWCVV